MLRTVLRNRALSRRPRRTAVVLLAANVLLLVAFQTLQGPVAYNSLYGWVANLSMLVPTAACFAHALLGGPRRAAAVWLGLAMLSQTAGNVIYSTWTQFQVNAPVPSPSDIAYLGFYVSVAAAMVCLVRRDQGSFPRALWLDGALGAAGAATALAALMNPVLSHRQGDLDAVLVGAAYTSADLLLVAMICGLLVARGVRGGSLWLWLAGGLTIFCAADVAYALRVTSGVYSVSPTLSLLWLVGVTCIARAIWQPERIGIVEPGRSKAILAIPMLATLIALVVLIIFSLGQDPVPVVLATFTMLLAGARTLAGFMHVQRLSDARRQAVTDELTGLGNRRALFEHGEARLQAADQHPAARADPDRSRQLQGDQRHLRPPRRRQAAARDRATPRRSHGRPRPARPPRRRRVRAADHAGPRRRRAPDRRADPRPARPAVRHRRARRARRRERRRRRTRGHGASDRGSAAARRRRDVRGQGRPLPRRALPPQLDTANRARIETIQDLDAALIQRQFVLHYQPKIDVATGSTFGAEALVRWQHPTRGLLYPDAFLPLVEQSGLMSPLTQLVLEAAVAQLASWRRAGLDISVAVNLSASDLLDESLAERIEGCSPSTRCPRARSSSRSPRASSWSTPSAPARSSTRSTRSGCASRSTTTAPATAPSPTSATSRSTSSRSTAPSSPTSRPTPQRRDRPLDRRARACPRPQGRRRRRGGPGGARCARGRRMRLRAGLSLLPPAAGGGLRRLDPGQGDRDRGTAPRRLGTRLPRGLDVSPSGKVRLAAPSIHLHAVAPTRSADATMPLPQELGSHGRDPPRLQPPGQLTPPPQLPRARAFEAVALPARRPLSS